MRYLMWLSLGFGAGCGLYCLGLEQFWWLLPVAFAAWLMARRKYPVLKPAGVLALGCFLGGIWFGVFENAFLAPAAQLDNCTVQTRIDITDYSYETDYGCAADGLLELQGRTYQVRLYVNEPVTLEPGDSVCGSFRMRLTAPGGMEEATYHSGKGIFLLAYQQGDVTFDTVQQMHWRCYPSILRQQIRQILAACFPRQVLGFVQALLIGDSSGLSYETDAALKVAGIRHVIAVSGLHVSVLFALVTMVTFRRRFLTALVGFPVLAVFAAAAGFTPSVTRACIMCGLMLLAALAEKEYDGPTALAFAALVMLLINPLVITSVGFQLSVASVAGIFLIHGPLKEFLMGRLGREKGRGLRKRLKSWLCSSCSMTLGATALTTPLCAHYFGMVSLIGAVTNLLVLWIITPVFCALIAVCGLYPLAPGAAAVLAKLVSLPVWLILELTDLLARIPLASVCTQSGFILLWLGCAYALAGVLLARKGKGAGACISWTVILLCIALLLSWYVPGNDGCSITMLDVGQGQCILLQSQGRSFLVDCGGDHDETAADQAALTLQSRGIRRLDGVILTHYDRDHMGGLPYLLTRVDTELLILPDTEDRDRRQQLSCAADRTVPVTDVLTLEYGTTCVTVFGPVYGGYSNENSLCVLFETENCDILITGDRSGFGERMLMRQFELPDVDILVAGHHGSGDSTTEELLRQVTPETVLISVSEDNGYGHPAQELLDRLAQHGCQVLRTDESGTIIIRR